MKKYLIIVTVLLLFTGGAVLFLKIQATRIAKYSPYDIDDIKTPNPIVKSGLYDCVNVFQEYLKEGNTEDRINLRSRAFIPKPNYSEIVRCLEQARDARKYYLIVQLWNIPNEEDRRVLESCGIKLLNYLDGKAWFAEVSNFKDLPEAKIVRWVGTIEPKDKMSPEVFSENFGSWSIQGDDVLLNVRVFPSFNRDTFEKNIKSYGVEIVGNPTIWPDNVTYTIKLSRTKVKSLPILFEEIYYIDMVPPPPTTE